MDKIVELADNVGHVFIATADKNGIPHIATAGKLRYDSGKKLIKVSEWFCSNTVANLNTNKFISIAVWDTASDKGYQLRGTLEGVHNNAVLNGYMENEKRVHFPQTRQELLIKVEKISDFNSVVHSDQDLLNLQEQG